MKTYRATHLGANAVAEMLPHGLLLVAFSGPITATSLPTLKRKIAAGMALDAARAVVSDYSSATVLLDDAAVGEMMAGGEAGNLPQLPAAVVAQGADLRRLRRAAIAAGFRHGLPRVVVPDRRQALRWAVGQIHARS